MAFEECLDKLSQYSPQTQVSAPECFVSFNVEQQDVGQWLEP
jgi:hypothetical protein